MSKDINAILEGLPVTGLGQKIGVKANIAIKGHACHGGIKAYEDSIADQDAVVVSRLRDAGYQISDILNMEEGALGAQTDNPWFGKTHNPLKYGYTPGGSSGGSAAAVAAGQVDMALGTDTMGSVRIPSAYCGLWGFKPSHNSDMIKGVMPLSPTLDTVGVHGRTFDDVCKVTEVISGKSYTRGKVGIIHALEWGEAVTCTGDVQTAFDNFITKIGGLPCVTIEPYAYEKSRRAGLIISEVEGYEFHRLMLAKKPHGFSNFFRGMLEYGSQLPQDKIDKAYEHVTLLRQTEFADFILMPTAPQTAFKFGSDIPANQADFTAFANLADRPAIQFPIGETQSGLPIGAQLVGPRGREADLIATMKTLLD